MSDTFDASTSGVGETPAITPPSETRVPEASEPREIRRLSVYWKDGTAHTFVLLPDDLLIDPLEKPEGAGEDWQPDPAAVVCQYLIIVRAVKPGTDQISRHEKIFLGGVAWYGFNHFIERPKPKVEVPQRTQFRNPLRAARPTPTAKNDQPVSLPPES